MWPSQCRRCGQWPFLPSVDHFGEDDGWTEWLSHGYELDGPLDECVLITYITGENAGRCGCMRTPSRRLSSMDGGEKAVA